MTDLDELERLRSVYDRATKCTSLIGAARLSLILDARAAYETALFAAAGELVRDARRYRWLRDVGFRSANLSLGVDSDGQDFAEFAFEFRAPESEYQMREPEDWRENDIDAAIDAAIAQEQPPDVPEIGFGNMAGGE